MVVKNLKIYESKDFEEYKKIKGYSFSSFRGSNPIAETKKMRLGTLVDTYLFTPQLYNGEQYNLVSRLGEKVREIIGDCINYGKAQLSLTADFQHNGFTMPYKGRPDLIIDDVVIDLKVSSLNPIDSIRFFKYNHQLSGYMYAMGAKKTLLCSINPNTEKVILTPIAPTSAFWERKIVEYGMPI